MDAMTETLSKEEMTTGHKLRRALAVLETAIGEGWAGVEEVPEEDRAFYDRLLEAHKLFDAVDNELMALSRMIDPEPRL